MATGRIGALTSAAVTALPLTYVQNDYITEVNLNRCYAYKKNGILFLRINALVNPNVPTAGDFVTIGTIGGWSAYLDVLMVLPPQGGYGAPITLQVLPNGTMRLFASSATYSNEVWYRAQISTAEDA